MEEQRKVCGKWDVTSEELQAAAEQIKQLYEKGKLRETVAFAAIELLTKGDIPEEEQEI